MKIIIDFLKIGFNFIIKRFSYIQIFLFFVVLYCISSIIWSVYCHSLKVKIKEEFVQQSQQKTLTKEMNNLKQLEDIVGKTKIEQKKQLIENFKRDEKNKSQLPQKFDLSNLKEIETVLKKEIEQKNKMIKSLNSEKVKNN